MKRKNPHAVLAQILIIKHLILNPSKAYTAQKPPPPKKSVTSLDLVHCKGEKGENISFFGKQAHKEPSNNPDLKNLISYNNQNRQEKYI